ncbi:hypothetical protein JCM8547_004344 [Rhodosporidiobolus lusitaniae]
MTGLHSLPPELLDSSLLPLLPLPSLLALSSTSSSLRSHITASYLPFHARRSLGYTPFTLAHLHFHSPSSSWVRKSLWSAQVSHNFLHHRFRGFTLGGPHRTWARCIPVLKLWEDGEGVGNVVVARGKGVEVWRAGESAGGVMRGADVLFDSVRGARGKGGTKGGSYDDVSALSSGLSPGELVVGRIDGTLARYKVAADARDKRRGGGQVRMREVARYEAGPGGKGGKGEGKTAVQALSTSGEMLVCAATTRGRPSVPSPADADADASLASQLASRSAPTTHSVTLHALASPWLPPTLVPYATATDGKKDGGGKPWSILLSPSQSSSSSSSPSWLAVGHTSPSPLSLISLTPSGPLAPVSLVRTAKTTSVYGLCSPSLVSSPFANPDQTVIAAFYDSTTSVFDLRLPAPSPSSSPPSSSRRYDPSFGAHELQSNEVLRLQDPWSDDPSFSLSSGGPSGSYICVGAARDSNIRLFDVRNPSSSVTAIAPGRDRSPVYGVAMEQSRLWAVTEQRVVGVEWDGFEGVRTGGGAWEGVGYVRHEGVGEKGAGGLRVTE